MNIKVIIVLALVVLLMTSVTAQIQVNNLGAQVLPTYEGCKNKKIGLVGASNTVDEDPQGRKVAGSMSQLLRENCPGAGVFLYAKGGWGPRAQKELVSSLLADHPDLDYVILDVSVNQMKESSLEVYTNDVIELARMVKEKNSNTKVVVLTPTPFNGWETWDQAVQAKLDGFNANLLSPQRLGVPTLIDYAVDAYSATEDPLGSDGCGKYCQQDHLHFYDGTGRRAVINAVLNTVFGSPRTPLQTSSASVSSEGINPSANCRNPQRCKEVDEVWRQIAQWLLSGRKGKVWDTTKGWIGFDELYAPKVQAPSQPSSPRGTVVGKAVSVVEIDNLRSESPEVVKDFIRVNLGEVYVEDVDYLTKILAQERGCTDDFKQERGAIAQVAINRVRSGQYGQTVKDVVASNKWNAGFATKIPAQKGIDDNTKIGCTISALKFMMCAGEEDIGAKEIGGRDHFVHRCTQKGDGLAVPSWNFDNPLMVQPENWNAICENPSNSNQCYSNKCGAHFSGTDTSPKDCSLRKYKGGTSPSLASSSSAGPAPVSVPGPVVPYTRDSLQQACTPESLLCVIPKENIGKQEAPGIGKCLPGMVQVGDFCIDQYESMLIDKNTGAAWSPYCNPGKDISRLRTVSIAGVIPQGAISQLQAKQACENAGKQLCSDEQWLAACQGSQKRLYPYSSDRKTAVCNDDTIPKPYEHVTGATVRAYCPTWKEFSKSGLYTDDPWMQHPKNNQNEVSLEATGTRTLCKTPENVYDLVGNLAEWTADTSGIFRGGYYQLTQSETTTNDGCLYRTTVHPVQYFDYSLGIRCCADPTS